uniref:Armadillo segment polarity protein n=1 Tax=Ditylenchus dipsaci TaxID=166011 RepID=A0A915E436_9BILA
MVMDYANYSDMDSTNQYDDLMNDVNGDHTNRSSIVDQFAEPSQLLKEAILDLLSVKDQLEDANDIPMLIRSLLDQDPAVVSRAAHLVYLLSKEDKCVATLAANEHLIGALVNAMVAVLSHLCHDNVGRMHIFRSGGIAELIRMLHSRIEVVVHYAVTTLHNLLLYIEQAKNEIIACEAFIPHLGSSNAKLQALVADCLYIMLLDMPQCKQTFLSLQGPRFLVNILQSNPSYVKLVYAVVRCIRSISTDVQSKASLISIGGLEALHQTLGAIYDNKRKLAVLNAMRNLSDAATNLDTLAICCACGILSNLTCNNICNKQAVCSNRGITTLARVLGRFAMMEDITEPALCTRHCTVRHPLAQQAQNELQFAHPIILTLLDTRRPPLVKAALGLIRNCALSQMNLQSILSKSTLMSGNLLIEDFEGLSDGVSLTEMVESAVSALHQLAKYLQVSQAVYRNSSLMNILVNLVSSDNIKNAEDELMMRELMGLLYQLTKSADVYNCAKTVQMFVPQPHIISALSSPHKSVAAYASIILKNIGIADKPIGYRSHDYGGKERILFVCGKWNRYNWKP